MVTGSSTARTLVFLPKVKRVIQVLPVRMELSVQRLLSVRTATGSSMVRTLTFPLQVLPVKMVRMAHTLL